MNKQFDNAKKRQTKKILQVCILTCVWMPNIPHQSLVKVGLVTWTVSLQGTVIHVVLFRFLPTAANHLNQPNQQNPTHTADPLLYIQTPHTRTLTHRDTPKDSGRHHVSPFSFFFFFCSFTASSRINQAPPNAACRGTSIFGFERDTGSCFSCQHSWRVQFAGFADKQKMKVLAV